MLLSALFILPAAAAVAFCCYLPYAAMLWVQKRRLPLMRHATLYLLVGTFVMLSSRPSSGTGSRWTFTRPIAS